MNSDGRGDGDDTLFTRLGRFEKKSSSGSCGKWSGEKLTFQSCHEGPVKISFRRFGEVYLHASRASYNRPPHVTNNQRAATVVSRPLTSHSSAAAPAAVCKSPLAVA
jgi:hypothetical protein